MKLVKFLIPAGVLLVAAVALALDRDSSSLTTSSEEAAEVYLLGLEQFSQIRFEEATRSWRTATKIDPEFALAWARLANMSHVWGSSDSTFAYLARAEETARRASYDEQLRVQQIAYRIRGDEDGEAEVLQQIIDRNPTDIEAYYSLHFMARRQRDPETCYKMLKRIIEIDPSHDLAYNELGYVLADLGRWDEALEALQKYAFINADEPNPHDSLGELYERVGRYPDAISEFQKAAEIDPAFTWARIHEARTLGQVGRFEDALRVLDFESEEPTAQVWRDFSRIETWLKSGDFDEVETALAELEDLERSRTSRLISEARLHFERGDSTGLAGTLAESEAYAQSVAADDARKKKFAASARALIHHYALRMAGDPDSAAAEVKLCLAPQEDWFARDWYSLRLAESQLEAGNFEDCLATVNTMIARNPNHPEGLLLRGRALEAQGNLPEAADAYRRSLEAWSEADPAAPLVELARMGLARVTEVS